MSFIGNFKSYDQNVLKCFSFIPEKMCWVGKGVEGFGRDVSQKPTYYILTCQKLPSHNLSSLSLSPFFPPFLLPSLPSFPPPSFLPVFPFPSLSPPSLFSIPVNGSVLSLPCLPSFPFFFCLSFPVCPRWPVIKKSSLSWPSHREQGSSVVGADKCQGRL